jgi:hypothetical protein
VVVSYFRNAAAPFNSTNIAEPSPESANLAGSLPMNAVDEMAGTVLVSISTIELP